MFVFMGGFCRIRGGFYVTKRRDRLARAVSLGFVLIMFMATAASLLLLRFSSASLRFAGLAYGRPTVAAVAPAQPNSLPATPRPDTTDIPNADLVGWVRLNLRMAIATPC